MPACLTSLALQMAAYSRLNADYEPSDVQPNHQLPDHALVAKENRLSLRKGNKGAWPLETRGGLITGLETGGLV